MPEPIDLEKVRGVLDAHRDWRSIPVAPRLIAGMADELAAARAQIARLTGGAEQAA